VAYESLKPTYNLYTGLRTCRLLLHYFYCYVGWNFWRHVLSVSWVILPNSLKGGNNFRYPDTKNDTEIFPSRESFHPDNLQKILKAESNLNYGGGGNYLYFTEKRVRLYHKYQGVNALRKKSEFIVRIMPNTQTKFQIFTVHF